MNRPVLPLLLILVFCGISPTQADEGMPPENLHQIEALQRRADTIGFGELAGTDAYHLAKARAWLNLAISEYHEGETSGTLAAAIEQAETLLDALENKQPDISMDTPVQLPGSEAVRPDLWNRIAALKKQDKFSCGQRPLAEAEVYLVWSGHEYIESGLKHAQSYVRNAEHLIYDARVAINDCAGTPAIAPPPALEKITLSGDALFEIGKATLNPSALWQLDRLAASIKKEAMLEQVELVGHTDRIRNGGPQDRNQLLSEQRAESIRQYLIGKGVPADLIHASGVGSSQPIVECTTKQSMTKQIACLQPNRRVEIILRGSR